MQFSEVGNVPHVEACMIGRERIARLIDATTICDHTRAAAVSDAFPLLGNADCRSPFVAKTVSRIRIKKQRHLTQPWPEP